MAVSDLNLLPATAGIQLQSSPYAPPAPLDFSQLSNLQQMENQQRRVEMEARRLDMAERQMEQAMLDRQAALERQNMLDRMTYVDRILDLPIPSKRAEEAAELQQKLGLSDLLDSSRTDLNIMDAAKLMVDYVSHPEVRKWTREQAAIEAMSKRMEKNPNWRIFQERYNRWAADESGTVPFPTDADLDYVDYNKGFDNTLAAYTRGAESKEAISDFIEAYYNLPEVRRQIEWDGVPGGVEAMIQQKKNLWLGYDPAFARSASHRTGGGTFDISGLPGANVFSESQKQNIAKNIETGGEDFTKSYIDALNAQKNIGTDVNLDAYDEATSVLIQRAAGGKEGLLGRSQVLIGGDADNPLEINTDPDLNNIGPRDPGRQSWLAGQALSRLSEDGSNISEILSGYELVQGQARGDKQNIYLEGRVNEDLLDEIIEGITRSSRRATRRAKADFRNTADEGIIIKIPLGSGDVLRRDVSSTGGTPQSPTSTTTPTTSYAANPMLSTAYATIIDVYESDPEIIDLGDGTTTLVGYNQLYKNGVPLQNYLNGLSEKSLEGLINNNQGLAKYLQLQNMGVRNPIENMTVKEVQDLQKVQVEATKGDPDIEGNAEGGNKGTSAMTRIQIIQKTLEGLLEQIENPDSEFHIEGFDRENNLFTQGLQDHLFLMLLERRGLSKFLEDPSTLDTFANNLAEEWEGVGKIRNNNERWNQFKDGLMAMRDEMLSSNQQEAQVTPPPTQEQSGESTDFNYYGFNFGGSTPDPVPGRGQILY